MLQIKIILWQFIKWDYVITMEQDFLLEINKLLNNI